MKKINMGEDFNAILGAAEQAGEVVLMQDNAPKFLLSKIEGEPLILTEDEKLEIIAKRILKQHTRAFDVLGGANE